MRYIDFPVRVVLLPIDNEFLNPHSISSKDRIVPYRKRAEIMCERLVLEQLYDATCFVLSSKDTECRVTQPASNLSFKNFAASIRGHAKYVLSMTSYEPGRSPAARALSKFRIGLERRSRTLRGGNSGLS